MDPFRDDDWQTVWRYLSEGATIEVTKLKMAPDDNSFTVRRLSGDMAIPVGGDARRMAIAAVMAKPKAAPPA